MGEPQDKSITFLTIGDEVLLSIMELLRMADVLSCSLVNKRVHSVAEAAMIPFRIALKRYGLEYLPHNSTSQSTPDRPLFELLDSIHSLNRNWLHLQPTSSSSLRIVDALEDVYFFRDYALADRVDASDSDDEETAETGWEIEIYKYGEAPPAPEIKPGESVVEIEEDGTIVEEIDAESHGIDVNAVETDEEDEEPGPDDTDAGATDDDDPEGAVILTTEGLHSVGRFRTTNSFITAYKVDVTQDLIITSEQWLRSKVKKGSRRPARGGLNFSRDTHFLRCLTVRDTKPHPACKAHLGAINVQYLCTNNKEEFDDPEDLRIQGTLVAFAVRHSLSHKVVIINWRDPLRPWTIPLEKESYLDMHFVANDLLAVLVCPTSDADIIRRSLDDESYPIAPEGGKMKLHVYYLGPNKNGLTSPCLVYSLVLPKFNNRYRVDTESAKILPQVSEASSRPLEGAPTVTDGLPYRTSDESGVFCMTFSGVLLKHPSATVEDDEDEMGTGWVIDIVMLKSHLLDMSRESTGKKDLGREIVWKEWSGPKGENVRVFPHSDEGWLGSPKLYEACSYRVASITPLKRGDAGNEVFPQFDPDDQSEKKKVVQADRRMDVLDFCPGRLEDVREALDAKRRQKELEENPTGQEADDGMFGVAAGALLDGEGSEITLVDASSTLEGGPFLERVDSTLPYILSRFDLDRGRKEDGSLPLPESLWMTETEIILQIEQPDAEGSLCPAFDRYTLA